MKYNNNRKNVFAFRLKMDHDTSFNDFINTQDSVTFYVKVVNICFINFYAVINLSYYKTC